jgi:hypothetical protein
MNPLLFIAKITSNEKIREWCAIKRYRQYEAKWAKEKITAATVTDPLELTWD